MVTDIIVYIRKRNCMYSDCISFSDKICVMSQL